MKRTVQKALRPLSSQKLALPPNIRARIAEKMEKLVKKALNGSGLSNQDAFVLDYLTIVVNFHNASDPKIKQKFLMKLGEKEREGYRHGFDKEDLISLNFLVLQAKVGGQLSALESRIKAKKPH